MSVDTRFMEMALALGRRGLGRVWPNPAVGCVIVAGGRVVGRGRTADGGRPHAETVALERAGAAAKGATAYVSLEPCAHHGRTPPCAGALAAAGVARVVTALTDPDPRVAGQGHAALRAAGVEVVSDLMPGAARAANLGFLSRVERGRPMLTLKLATSLDGRIATASGESRWITGASARRVTHAMRAEHDAILVGGGTARADDPALTVRELGVTRQPVRVVAARDLDLPRDGRLAAGEGAGPLWLVHGADAPEEARCFWEARATLLAVETGADGRLAPGAILAALGAEGLTRVFCEGGGAFAAALLRSGLVDRLAAFTAGVALGADGRPALGPFDLPALADAPRLRLLETRQVGEDVLHVWAPGTG